MVRSSIVLYLIDQNGWFQELNGGCKMSITAIVTTTGLVLIAISIFMQFGMIPGLFSSGLLCAIWGIGKTSYRDLT
jgi:hypothetical protein